MEDLLLITDITDQLCFLFLSGWARCSRTKGELIVTVKARICCHMSCKEHKCWFKSCQLAAEMLTCSYDSGSMERWLAFAPSPFPVLLQVKQCYLHNCLWNGSTEDVQSFKINSQFDEQVIDRKRQFQPSEINSRQLAQSYSGPVWYSVLKVCSLCRAIVAKRAPLDRAVQRYCGSAHFLSPHNGLRYLVLFGDFFLSC